MQKDIKKLKFFMRRSLTDEQKFLLKLEARNEMVSNTDDSKSSDSGMSEEHDELINGMYSQSKLT